MLSNMGHGWQNVINANGLTITAIGILLVFASLFIISLIISLTPHLLVIIGKYFPEEEAQANGNNVKKVSETEVVAAISAALCYSIQSSKQ